MSSTNASKTARSPFAELKVIDLDLLRSGLRSEQDNLRQACEVDGFFYLDLRSDAHRSFWETASRVLELMGHYFHQPLEIKMQDNIGSDWRGLLHSLAFAASWIADTRYADTNLRVLSPVSSAVPKRRLRS